MATPRTSLVVLLALLACALLHSGDARVAKRSLKLPQTQPGVREPVVIGGKSYMFGLFDAVTWLEALVKCDEAGMQLASLQTKVENDAVMTWISQNPAYDFWMWTSGTRAASSPTWMWDATAEQFSAEVAWLPGEPSNPAEEQSCMNFSAFNGGWDDDYCDRKMSYLCEEITV